MVHNFCEMVAHITPLRCYITDVIMSVIAFLITRVAIVYSIVCSGVDQRKHQSSASLAFVRGIHRWPVNSPHKGPVTRKMFPCDDVIMIQTEVWSMGLAVGISGSFTCFMYTPQAQVIERAKMCVRSSTYIWLVNWCKRKQSFVTHENLYSNYHLIPRSFIL